MILKVCFTFFIAGFAPGIKKLYSRRRLVGEEIVPLQPPVVIGGTPLFDSLLCGSRTYELSNHLGNVLSVISDKKVGVTSDNATVDYYVAEVLSQTDYYPGGMEMPGRTYNNTTGYRYGFNGMEKDNEIAGAGNCYTTEFRFYDSRLVRWFSVDPVIKAGWSPYNAMDNNPNVVIDPEGDNGIVIIDKEKKTVTFYTPILHNNKDNELLAKVQDATPEDIRKGLIKAWDNGSLKKVSVDIGDGKMEDWTINFVTDFKALDNADYNKELSAISNDKYLNGSINYVEVSEGYGGDYWSNGRIEMRVGEAGKYTLLDPLVDNYGHEIFSHGYGLGHSKLVVVGEVTLPNGKTVPKIGGGMSSYAGDKELMQWELDAISIPLIQKALQTKDNKVYYKVNNSDNNPNAQSGPGIPATQGVIPIGNKKTQEKIDKKAEEARSKNSTVSSS
jgi:RHS repeat-associated protein